MADPIGTANQIVKIALAIRRAVQTVRRNEEECRDIEQLATRVSSILSQLLETAAATSDPAMDGAMAALEKSLDRALKLVTSCQKRSTMHRVCAAGAMARQLRRVQDDILRQMVLGVFATTTQLTLSLNMLLQPGAGAPPPAHPPRSSRWPFSLGIEAGKITGVFCCLSFCCLNFSEYMSDWS
jgi:L1 cell adhesion molecule like protein